MSQSNLNLTVMLQREYETDYRVALWQMAREDAARWPGGDADYFARSIKPLLDANLHRIRVFPNTKYTYNANVRDQQLKFVYNYLRTDESGTRPYYLDTMVSTVHVFDAYIKIKYPVLSKTFRNNRGTTITGEILGDFMKDHYYELNRMNRAILYQKISGVYEYDAVNITGREMGYRRFLCLFEDNRNPEYLITYDLYWSPNDDIVFMIDEQLTLYYGYCSIGRNFSPVVLRSITLGHRQTGMLFSLRAIVEADAPVLDQLYMHTFTSESEVVDIAALDPTRGELPERLGQDLADAAYAAFLGPRQHRELNRVKDQALTDKIKKRLDRIRKEFL